MFCAEARSAQGQKNGLVAGATSNDAALQARLSPPGNLI